MTSKGFFVAIAHSLLSGAVVWMGLEFDHDWAVAVAVAALRLDAEVLSHRLVMTISLLKRMAGVPS